MMSTGFRSNSTASAAKTNGALVANDRPVPLARLAQGSAHSDETSSADGVVGIQPGAGRYDGRLDPRVSNDPRRHPRRTPQEDQWHNGTFAPKIFNKQPAPPSWIPPQLDPASKEVFEEIVSTHTSNGKLKFVVTREIERSSKELAEDRNWLGERVSYSEFITDLLYPDEVFLLNGQSLPFTNVNFHVCEEWVPEPHRWGTHKALRPPAKGPMLAGRAFLTNHRLILFSAEKQRATTLKKSTAHQPQGENYKPAGYQLRATNLDAVHFQSIPLTHFRNVEMYVAAGTSSVTNIVGQRLFCCLPLRCCLVCYEDDMCSKHWYARDQLTIGSATRMLSLGAVLPPWGNRSLLEMHLRPDVPLSLMKGFMVQLQRHSPGLRSIAQKPQEHD